MGRDRRAAYKFRTLDSSPVIVLFVWVYFAVR